MGFWMGVFAMTEIEKYQSLDPTRFDILDKFEVYQHCSDDEDHIVLVELRLRMFEHEEDDDCQRLVLSFSGVRDLKVHFQGFMLLPVVHIRSIRQYQWEKLNYEVKDAENQSFSFVCENFKASLEEISLEH
jgi:hypothetical protein